MTMLMMASRVDIVATSTPNHMWVFVAAAIGGGKKGAVDLSHSYNNKKSMMMMMMMLMVADQH